MKLARRLILALLSLILIVLLTHTGLWLNREVGLYERDMARDQRLIGQTVATVMAGAYASGGWLGAESVLINANLVADHVRMRLLRGDSVAGEVGSSGVAVLEAGGPYVLTDHKGVPGSLRTFIPLMIQGQSLAAIEVSELFDEEREFLRGTIFHMLTITAILATGAAVLVSVIGIVFIGRPMRILVAAARRIGAGDIEGHLTAAHDDEIGDLAKEMNLMCEHLADAREAAARENSAKIEAIQQLRHADRLAAVGTMASGIAHELGTPLNVVSGRAKLIETGAIASGEVPDNARIIREQADRIAKIVRGLLDFSRRSEPERSRVDLRPLVTQTAGFLQSFAQKRRVVIQLELDEEPLWARVDGGQIQQVITNLLMNGIQAMPEGGVLHLRGTSMSARPPADVGGVPLDCAVVEVRDHGEGIVAEALPRIFDPFFTTKAVGEGTGLGLSVSYGIVREHDGWIEVESVVSEGTTFRVCLPFAEDPCAAAS
ncbi:MAG: ATP-binding protein [Candidatus Eisenbacteria bacterium]